MQGKPLRRLPRKRLPPSFSAHHAASAGSDSETDRLELLKNVTSLGLRADNRLGTYVWTGAMGLRLADLPPEGATIERDEYERHKAVYVAIQRCQENGMDPIEAGVVFEHVRVCQIEPGVTETCEVK